MVFGRPLKNFPGWMASRRAEFAFALRVTVSAALALLVAQLLRLPLPLWAVLTAVIVSQLSIGQSLKSSTDYVLGTIGGSLYGGAVALLVPHATESALLGVLVIAVAPLALYSAMRPNMNVVPISAIIVLLVPALIHSDPLTSVIDRIIEVGIGALIGLLVAVLLVPTSAHRQARDAAAHLLDEMALGLTPLIGGVLDGMAPEAIGRIQDRIGAALATLDSQTGIAERERAARLSSGTETGPLRRTLSRLRHDLIFLGRAVGLPMSEPLRDRLRPLFNEVAAAGADHLRASASALRQGIEPPTMDRLVQALDAYGAGMDKLRHEGATLTLSGDAAERFFAAGFAFEQMRRNLGDLDRVIGEWRQPKRPPPLR
ncbi:MAG: FUSC family protein [Pseudomonadota bacterium]